MKITKNVCMVVFSHYPNDPRVRREAEALIEKNYSVDVVCLRDKNETKRESFQGVSIYRLPIRKKRSTKIRYFIEYLLFLVLSSIIVTCLQLKKSYNIMHIHNMPDILVFSCVLSKFFGAKIILDLHDPTPEVFMTKYDFNKDKLFIKLLVLFEKLSIKFAHLILTPNISFRDLFISRGCPGTKIHIIMNSPQETIFNMKIGSSDILNEDKKFVLMFHGTIVERHGLDIALHAINRLTEYIPDIVFNVYGTGDYVESFIGLRDELGLDKYVVYHGFLPLEEIARNITQINIGIIPNKMSVFTNLNFPTRIFEYLSMGKPVIVPRTKGICDYFTDESILFFEPGNAKNLSTVIYNAYMDQSRTNDVLNNGLSIYENLSWKVQKEKYLSLYETLLI